MREKVQNKCWTLEKNSNTLFAITNNYLSTFWAAVDQSVEFSAPDRRA